MILRLLCLGALLMATNVSAQQEAYFHQIGMSDGLYQNFIRSIIQTSDGFVWVGTQLSLDRYDSHDFKHFTHDDDDPRSLPLPEVYCLYEDQQQTLWTGCVGGLARYRPETEDFQHAEVPKFEGIPHHKISCVRSLLEHPDGTLWVGTERGALPFSPESFSFDVDLAFLQQQYERGVRLVADMATFSDDYLLLATDNGPFLLSISRREVKALDLPAGHNLNWMSLEKLPDGRFLAGTGDGLLRFDLSAQGTFINLEHERLAKQSDGKSNAIVDILVTPTDGSYLATSNGMRKFDWQSDSMVLSAHYQHDQERASSLAGDQLQCLALIEPGWVWAGTRHGISILDRRPDFIELYSKNRLGSDICSDALKGMASSPSGRFLVIGGDQGLTIIDLLRKSSRCLNRANFPSLRNEYIINVAQGPEPDSYWLCFRRGGADLLYGVESGELRIKPVMYPEAGTKGTGVYDKTATADGMHWLATAKGLYAYDPAKEQGQLYQPDPDNPRSLPDSYIFSLLTDHQDQLWLGLTREGLARLDSREEFAFTNWKKEPTDSNGLINNMILDLHQDTAGRIWLATPSGLGVWLEGDKFRAFTEKEGLPGNLIFNVLEDDKNNLWVSSPAGLAKVRLSSSDAPLKILDVFHVEDGLPIARAQYGFNLLPDGRFALSGGGIQLFHPDSLHHDRSIGQVKITGFNLFNEPVIPGEEGVLAAAISTLDHITLKPSQNFLSFTFADLNFNPYRQVDYEYRLLGMHENWLPANNRRHVSFPRLGHGEYTLEVRAINPAVNESGPITQLGISLLRPWYFQWWFFVLCIGAFCGIWWTWNQHLLAQERQLAEVRLEERESFRRRSARDFHDEAGNHLTRVSLLTEVARREYLKQGNMQGILSQIDENVQVLREGMRDFIWALDPGNDNAYELVLRLKRFGQELFEHHPGKFLVEGLDKALLNLNLPSDQRRHLILLFKEAMHNSLKHATAANLFMLAVERGAQGLTINWTDNGPGFAESKAAHRGSGLNNMQTRADKIGAQLSIEQSSSGVIIKLSLTQ